ncbi:glycoside hydrolase family 75 protein [Streptomyces varsoviensis]|uniref:glycoside hydrolase family 75 protein n=1 Tax=Streptomyces varsoviensis TaxID=67373 RepID=UPI0033D3A18F
MRTRTLAVGIAAAATALAVVPAAAQAHNAPSGASAKPAAHGLQEGSVSAAALLAKVNGCKQISKGKYRTDEETSATVPVCEKTGAVYWKADMDVDCDGQVTSKCNKQTDPWFQDDTYYHTSDDKPLNAEKLPYVVVPSVSGIWDYTKSGIKGGGVVAVIYNNQVEYAVVGDTGPDKIIGEASYAAAKGLGIDPDPKTGGAESGVTYILFKNSQASPIESHSDAVRRGDELAKKFVAAN